MNFVEIFVNHGVNCPSEIKRKLALSKERSMGMSGRNLSEEDLIDDAQEANAKVIQ
jgi:hypothetical protein